MTLPTGAISLGDLQTEYGGSNPIGLNEYYANGTYVPIGATSIPTSGAINLNTFRGKNLAPNYVTNGYYGAYTKYGTIDYYGWSLDAWGSINNRAVLSHTTSSPKYGTFETRYNWRGCYWSGSYLYIIVEGDLRNSGPDYFRVGTDLHLRTSFTRTYYAASGSIPARTTLQKSLATNPFGTTTNLRIRVSNYFTTYGEPSG